MFDFITKPFGWLMMALFEFTKNYGLAVILFALVVKVILLPFQMKSKRSMMRTSRLQPKMKELEKKHGANKQKYNEEVQKLYKEEKINPMSGCLWSLLPFPIIIALFAAIRQPLTIMMNVTASLLKEGGTIYNLLSSLGGPVKSAAYLEIEQAVFISRPENISAFQQLASNIRPIDYHFLGMNLGDTPRWDFIWNTTWSDSSVWLPGLLLFLLPIVSGVLAYFSSKVNMQMNPSAGGQQQQSSNKMMLMMMPIISVFFAFSMPGAIGVYIIASTAFAMIQDIILTKHYTKIMDAEDAVKFEQQRIKEAELEAKRLETERKKLDNKTEANPNTSKKKQQKSERQEQLEKTAEWEKKNTPVPNTEEDPSRIGTRRFARGRAYDPSRFDENGEVQDQPEEAPLQELASGISDNEDQAEDDPNESSITNEGDDRDDEID
jgi:YidC/Oxa1 family membrane protein insertase